MASLPATDRQVCLVGVIVDDIEEGSFRQGVFETQAAFDGLLMTLISCQSGFLLLN